MSVGTIKQTVCLYKVKGRIYSFIAINSLIWGKKVRWN